MIANTQSPWSATEVTARTTRATTQITTNRSARKIKECFIPDNRGGEGIQLWILIRLSRRTIHTPLVTNTF